MTHPSLLLADSAGFGLNTANATTLLVKDIAPLLLVVVGIVILAGAKKGNISKTMNIATVAIIGLVFVGGAATLFLLGGKIASGITG